MRGPCLKHCVYAASPAASRQQRCMGEVVLNVVVKTQAESSSPVCGTVASVCGVARRLTVHERTWEPAHEGEHGVEDEVPGGEVGSIGAHVNVLDSQARGKGASTWHVGAGGSAGQRAACSRGRGRVIHGLSVLKAVTHVQVGHHRHGTPTARAGQRPRRETHAANPHMAGAHLPAGGATMQHKITWRSIHHAVMCPGKQ